MKKILVIGLGNEWRGDDSLGLVVAQKLAAILPPQVKVNTHIQDTFDLVQAWSEAAYVIIVDSIPQEAAIGLSQADPAPSFLRLDLLHDSLKELPLRASSHFLNIHEAVELSRNLGSLAEEIIVFGIVGSNYEVGASTSAGSEKLVATVVDQIQSEINSIINRS